MTQVGKILVLVIMAFSLIFLGISTMVFVTSKNWKDATAKKDAEVKKIKGELQTEQAKLAEAKKNLEDAQAAATTATKAAQQPAPDAGRPEQARPGTDRSRSARTWRWRR